MTLKDGNGDTALHWAAYKGFVEIVGLLTYCMPHAVDMDDVFGQTPLHLSALRGNEEVVEYLVVNCGADVSKKDRNLKTALDLAVQKNQLKAEWALRRLTSSGVCGLLFGLNANRLKEARVLSFLFCGSNEREISAWPWRIVFMSNLVASVTTVYFAMDEHLADLYALHLANTIVQVLWWIMFVMCLIKSPSYVRDDSPAEAARTGAPTYEAALVAIGQSAADEGHFPAVCHSCHVCRPIRSKHCKISRRCVNKFDHFCPFVGNTVGRDNYKYFVGLLVAHLVAALLWETTAVYLWRRTPISWSLFLYMLYALLWLGMICGLLYYHTQLILANLTTNEQINLSKYVYMRGPSGLFENPFDKGSPAGNLLDALFPSSKVFFSREELVRYKQGLGRHYPEEDSLLDEKEGFV